MVISSRFLAKDESRRLSSDASAMTVVGILVLSTAGGGHAAMRRGGFQGLPQ